MASAAVETQDFASLRANRRNAQKSTGPRTEEGKAASAQNAVKHGLLGQRDVISSEDPAEFDGFREQMLRELHPAGLLETVLDFVARASLRQAQGRLCPCAQRHGQDGRATQGRDALATSADEAGELGSFVQMGQSRLDAAPEFQVSSVKWPAGGAGFKLPTSH